MLFGPLFHLYSILTHDLQVTGCLQDTYLSDLPMLKSLTVTPHLPKENILDFDFGI